MPGDYRVIVRSENRYIRRVGVPTMCNGSAGINKVLHNNGDVVLSEIAGTRNATGVGMLSGNELEVLDIL